MTEEKKENNPSVSTVNTYTIQEITAIFGEIDEKILSLHSCSSEDFLTLNAYFKKYYADSKTISNNAKNLLNIITNEESRKAFILNLKNFGVQLQNLLEDYEAIVNHEIDAIEHMIQEMDKMFVTANNLKQDVMTLKLLVANLKLDIIISAGISGRIASKANDFNELIIQTKSFFVEFYKRSNSFKDKIKLLSGQFMQQRDRNVKQINDIINEINLSANLLDEKYNEAIQLAPRLTESTQNTSSSIDKIITNLQYQDIIRQKIDHIQQTHRDILKKIKNIENSENEEDNLKNKLDWFIQIRDIAGLQAAQLIHTNKEYQKAIEIISGKFLEVGSEMTDIAGMCHQLIGNSNGSNSSYYESIREKLEKAEYFTEIFEKSVQFINERKDFQERELGNVISNFEELSDFLFTIEKSITRSLDRQSNVEVEQYEATTSQIREILSEIKSINNLYHSQFEKIKAIRFVRYSDKNAHPVDALNLKLQQFIGNGDDLIKNLFENNENIFKIIAENQVLSKKISSDIKTSLEQIKYYDFFDKVIEEIILKLNDINLKLQSVEGIENADKLEYLKARYTMESEHKIHESITLEGLSTQFDFNSTGAEEEDDNLELF